MLQLFRKFKIFSWGGYFIGHCDFELNCLREKSTVRTFPYVGFRIEMSVLVRLSKKSTHSVALDMAQTHSQLILSVL